MSNLPIDLQALIEQGNKVFETYVKYDTHQSQPSAIVDSDIVNSLISDMDTLSEAIGDFQETNSEEAVAVRELKRMCKFYKDMLLEDISDHIQTPAEILEKYQVTDTDIDLIKDWLLTNREAIILANKNQYEFQSKTRFGTLDKNSIEMVTEASQLLNEFILIMKDWSLSAFPTLPIKDLFANYLIGTTMDRAASNRFSKYIVLSMSCLRMYQAKVVILPEIAIEVFAHEVLGHGLNYQTTDLSTLPFFIKENRQGAYKSTSESVTTYFESSVFEHIVTSDISFSTLGINESIEEIYKRRKDTELLSKYFDNLYQLGWWILCKTTESDYDKQKEFLDKYSLEPSWSSYFLTNRRNDWNKKTGLILPRIAAEVKYSVDSVGRVLAKRKPTDIAKFEKAILTGAWSPAGFEEWVNLTGF